MTGRCKSKEGADSRNMSQCPTSLRLPLYRPADQKLIIWAIHRQDGGLDVFVDRLVRRYHQHFHVPKNFLTVPDPLAPDRPGVSLKCGFDSVAQQHRLPTWLGNG